MRLNRAQEDKKVNFNCVPSSLQGMEKWRDLVIPLPSCNPSTNLIAEGILSPKNSVSYFKASYRGKNEKHQNELLASVKRSCGNNDSLMNLKEKSLQDAWIGTSQKDETASASSSSSAGSKTEKPLFNMVIEGKDGRKDVIEIFKGDSPLLLAYKFCFKNGVDPQLAEPLSEKIKQAFDAWNKQRKPGLVNEQDGEARGLKKFDSQDFSMLTMKLLNKINIEAESKRASQKEPVKKSSPSEQILEYRPEKYCKSEKENLYERGKIFLVKKNTSLEKKRKRLEEETEKQLTFHPKINLKSNSQAVIEKRKQLPANEFLYQTSKFKEKKRVISMKRQEEALMSNYPFHPKINDRSAIISNKNREKRLKQREISDESSRENQSDQSYSFSRTSKGKAANTSMSNLRNLSFCGQAEAFRPQLFRSRSSELIQKQRGNDKSFQIHEYLYNNRLQKENKIKELLEKKEEEQRRAAAPCVRISDSRRSEILLQGRKLRKFEEIFRLLDEDGDGYIRGEAISTTGKFNKDLLPFLQPFLSELEKNGKSMDLRRFCIVMDNICNSMSILERDRLLQQEATGRSFANKEIYNKCTFKPQLNQRSLLLARKKELNRESHSLSLSGNPAPISKEAVNISREESLAIKNFHPKGGSHFGKMKPNTGSANVFKDDSFSQCQRDFQSFIEKYSSCF